MQTKHLVFKEGWHDVFSNERAQAAEMTIKPGGAEGGPANSHRSADQWLFVISGTGEAIVNGASVALKRGTLLLIEHHEKHQIKNTGKSLLRTLNFYSPPGFDHQGNRLTAGKKD